MADENMKVVDDVFGAEADGFDGEKFEILAAASEVKVTKGADPEALTAAGEDYKAGDVIRIEAWLCHSFPFVNTNGYRFDEKDLYAAVADGQFHVESGVVLDVNHDFVVRGVVLKGSTKKRTLDGAGEVVGVKIDSLFLAWRFHDVAEKILQEAGSGQLEFSMTCYTNKVECAVCGNVSTTRAGGCEHVRNGGEIWVREPRFKTASIILPPHNPADRNATATDVSFTASDEANQNDATDLEATEIEHTDTNLEVTMEKDIQRLEAENAELKDKLALAEAAAAEADQNAADQKISDLEAAKADMETKAGALEAEKAELTDKVGALEADKAALEAANAELEAQLATITAENKKLQMVQANAARKEKIEEVVGNKLEASAVAGMVTSWMFAEADGEISGRSDAEFEAFVAGLANAVDLIVAEPEEKKSEMVTDPQNGGIGVASGASADEPKKTAMDKLFDAI